MAEQGVTPLDEGRRGSRKRGGPPRARPPASPSAPTRADPPARHTGGTGHGAPPDRHEAALSEREATLSEREATLDRREAALSEREATLSEREAALGEREVTLGEREVTLSERESDLGVLRRERNRLDEQVRGLQRKLAEARAPAPSRERSLAALLQARGLEAPENAGALRLLLDAYPHALLEALSPRRAEDLSTLLDRRLVLSCGDGRCADTRRAAVLIVPPGRCELCGGSGAGRAFRDFAEACREAGIHKVVIVGGSPAYRRVLRELAAPGRSALRVEVIDGKARPREKKIRGLARGADRVLIWGATILDHATSDAFEASGARTITIPHRGIATMLRTAAAHIRGD